MNWDDNLVPLHIEKVNSEARNIFSHLRGVEGRPLESQLARILGVPYERIDFNIAWDEADALSYNAVFAETGGDMESLYEPGTRSRIMSRISYYLPIRYFTRKLVQGGIMDVIENRGDMTYYIKEIYRDSVNTLSKDSSTKSPE